MNKTKNKTNDISNIIPLEEIIQMILNAETDEDFKMYKQYYYNHYIKPNKKK